MYVLGCDPGKTGAIVAVSPTGPLRIIRTPHMESKTGRGEEIQYALMWEQTKKMLAEIETPQHVFIERVQAMPKEGASSGFKFGYSAGFLRGLVTALGYRYDMIEPQAWKKTHRIPHGADKKASIIRACELWPKQVEELTPKRLHWDQTACFGVCDAALIGYHGLILLNAFSAPVINDDMDF